MGAENDTNAAIVHPQILKAFILLLWMRWLMAAVAEV
jgi:hypothetical protein